MQREKGILLILLLLHLPSLAHALMQKIHKRSVLHYSIILREWRYLNLDRRGLDENLLRHILEEAGTLGSNCLLLISDREVDMDDTLLPIARLTLAEVSRWIKNLSQKFLFYLQILGRPWKMSPALGF